MQKSTSDDEKRPKCDNVILGYVRFDALHSTTWSLVKKTRIMKIHIRSLFFHFFWNFYLMLQKSGFQRMSERGDIALRSWERKNMILRLSFSIFRPKFDFDLELREVKSWSINLIFFLHPYWYFAVFGKNFYRNPPPLKSIEKLPRHFFCNPCPQGGIHL